MNLPFTLNQFVGLFRDYNLAIWPIQAIMYGLAITAAVLVFHKKNNKDRFISAILSIFWFWTGIEYHIIYFTRINKAAYIFGAFFITQSILFLTYGAVKNKITIYPERSLKTVLGSLFIIYAIVIYPVVGYLLGHGYPYSPLLGVTPCPTTIFTFGILLLAKPIIPLKIIWIPLLWSIIGFNAAWTLGIWEDTGLLAAGVTSVALIAYEKHKYSREGRTPVIVEKAAG